ncbi:MAG: hypothetical protein LAP21_12875, partial [Acidobacteriia bacterium]|nr:hypothetical protein [Terriglobia bacterium]
VTAVAQAVQPAYYNVVVTARTTGTATNYALSSSTTYDSAGTGDFAGPSFTTSNSGANLTGGTNPISDSGTVTLTIGSFTASAPYGPASNSSAAQVATALIGTGTTGLNRAGSPVTATASGANITLTYNSIGLAGNVAATLTSSSGNPSIFPGGSFSGSTTLGNGADPYSSGLAHPYSTTYTYDSLSDLLAVSQAAGTFNGQSVTGQPRSYTYDSFGRILTATTPESGTATNYYTTSGGAACAGDPSLVCRVQDARSVVKTFTYDGINRPATVSYSDGTPGVTYTYDTGGAAAFALDRLTKITEGPTNSQTFSYDNFGRINSVSHVIDTTTYLTQYSYNLAGQLASITYPTTRAVLQNYDAIGRLCAVGASGSTCTTGTNYLSGLTYNAAGETSALTMGNGVLGAFTYNDHLQLSTLRYFKGSTDVLNLAYDYTATGVTGNNGQIQAVHYYTAPGTEDPTKSEQFTYDPWSRLSAAQTGVVNTNAGSKTWSMSWAYDRLGNRTGQSFVSGDQTLNIGQPQFTIDPNTNHITNTGFQYDGAGNLINDGTNAYFYDGANRLRQINSGAAVYSYFGPLRIKKVLGTTATVYIYSGNKPIVEYVNGSVSKEYIYAGSQLLATVAASGTTYRHPDHLSIRAETDASGNMIGQYGNLPYGDPWYGIATGTKWRFTSYERDFGTGETGLDYAQFRYYASGQGRFMSADMMGGSRGVPQSLNRYAYSMNDPVNLADPLGLSAAPMMDVITICKTPFWGTNYSDGSTTIMTGYPVCEFVVLDIGGNAFGSLFGGGGGGPGDGGPTSNSPKVNIRALADCIFSLFGVTLTSFSPPQSQVSLGNDDELITNIGGSFTGFGPDVRDNGGYNYNEISVSNNNNLFTRDDLTKLFGYPAIGRTDGFFPDMNFAAGDIGPEPMLMAQIFELGNSLGYITGQVRPGQSVNQSTGPQNTEQGAKLKDCYKKGGPQ